MCEPGAVDGSQQDRFPFSQVRNPTLLFSFLRSPQGQAALSALPSRGFSSTWLIPGESYQRNRDHRPMSHTQPLRQDRRRAGPPARALGHLQMHTEPFSLGPTTHQLGSPQRKPTVSPPSMCFSVPPAHGRDARSPPASPPFMPFSQSHFSMSVLLPVSPCPPPQIHKRRLQSGVFFSTGIERWLSFLSVSLSCV